MEKEGAIGALSLDDDMGHMLDIEFENNCEVGVSSKLTNAYCMVAIGGSYRVMSKCIVNCGLQGFLIEKNHMVESITLLNKSGGGIGALDKMVIELLRIGICK